MIRLWIICLITLSFALNSLSQNCPTSCKTCTVPTSCEVCLSGYFIDNHKCSLCEEEDCDSCPNNRCEKCIEGFKLTEKRRCLSLGNGVMYLAGAIIAISFILICALFCCLYNWKKIRPFFEEHFKDLRSMKEARNDPKKRSNKVAPLMPSNNKSTTNLDESRMAINNPIKDEDQIQNYSPTAAIESKIRSSDSANFGSGHMEGQIDKPTEAHSLNKNKGEGQLNSNRSKKKNVEADWELSSDAAALEKKKSIGRLEVKSKKDSILAPRTSTSKQEPIASLIPTTANLLDNDNQYEPTYQDFIDKKDKKELKGPDLYELTDLKKEEPKEHKQPHQTAKEFKQEPTSEEATEKINKKEANVLPKQNSQPPTQDDRTNDTIIDQESANEFINNLFHSVVEEPVK